VATPYFKVGKMAKLGKYEILLIDRVLSLYSAYLHIFEKKPLRSGERGKSEISAGAWMLISNP
jgi:hypothetical protein